MAEAIVSSILEQLASSSTTNVERLKDVVGGDEVGKLRGNLVAVQPVLEDAEKRQVVDKKVKVWLEKLQGTSYDIEDVLDEWKTRPGKLQPKEDEEATKLWKKVRSLMYFRSSGSRHVFILQQNIASRIKDLNKTLDRIVEQKDYFNFSDTMRSSEEQQKISSVVYLPKICGKDYDKNQIVNHLLRGSSQAQAQTLPVISIVEMMGTEKTTLVELVVEDDRVKTEFEKIIRVHVHKFFGGIKIAREILRSLELEVALDPENLETLLGTVHQHLEGKRFLLVLDDVWIEIPEVWEQFKNSLCVSQGSSILVTTCTIKTAKMMGTTKMILLGNEWQSLLSLYGQIEFSGQTSKGKMLDVKCWLLFSKIVFSTLTSEEHERLRLKGLYKKILSTCNGLPSAVMILGNLLSSKTKIEELESVCIELLKLEERKPQFPTPLILSYYDFPSKLKKCFSYCAIFPKDFVINKDKLIKLWMAQGYLKESGREDLELVGEEYFAILAMCHFFQDFEPSVYDGSIIRCKMPHVVHDFAKFLMEKECLSIIRDDPQKSQSEQGARHVMIIDGSIPISSIHNKTKLRSLVVNNKKIGGELFDLFEELACLRTLDLSDCFVEEIPGNLKNLMHLRYLNLSHNEKIEELPETVCELYYLEILDLSNCYRLKKLPHKIENLKNLRHLMNHRTGLSYMPRGFEVLTCLQTLTKFVVSNGNSNQKVGGLECLKGLKQLEGFLSLTGLGNLSGEDEINKGDLDENKNIYALSLRFDGWTNVDDEKNFEKFKPPPNLEELVIQCYTGKSMPLGWIEKLTKLRMLKLLSCFEFKELPNLGKLSSVELLIICNMRSVRKVDDAFFGIDTEGTASSSSGASIAFPKLRYLKFSNMIEWEELTWSQSTIMPCLRYLELDSCPKLKSLSLLGELPSLESLIIKRMKSLKRAGDEFLGTSSSSSSTLPTFPKLMNLEFEDMREWEEWNVKWDGRVMPNLLSLKFLSCPNLVALPDNLLHRPALQRLVINDCSVLKEIYHKEAGKDWCNISHIPYVQIDSSEYVHGNESKVVTPPPDLEHPADRQDSL